MPLWGLRCPGKEDLQKRPSPSHNQTEADVDRSYRSAREDISKISEPRAKVLFEKTANLLSDLRKEYEGYERR